LLLKIIVCLFLTFENCTITISSAFLAEKSYDSIANTSATTPNLSTVPPELLATITKGKKLFRTNCATCHNKNMKSDMTGPALAGVRDRWSAYPESDLYAWIKNSTKLVEADHPKAIEIYKEWDEVTMTAFNNMTEAEIAAILDYIDSVK